jgi:hypothetical protein
MIEEGLYAFLAALGAASSRIYPMQLPQNGALPAVTFTRVTASRTRSLGGPSGMARAVFQIDAWAATYVGAKALAETLRQGLDGHRGAMGAETVGGVLLLADRDLFEEATDTFRVSMDFAIWHQET